MAWKSNDESTWELISWRYPENIGHKREISSAIVKEMEINHPETFVNRDPTQEKGLIAPRTHVLYSMVLEVQLLNQYFPHINGYNQILLLRNVKDSQFTERTNLVMITLEGSQLQPF